MIDTPSGKLYQEINVALVAQARYWLGSLKNRLPKERRDATGFYITAYNLTNPEQPILICQMLIGDMSDYTELERHRARSSKMCIEQLGKNPSHVSSAQSADEATGCYAGGVRSSNGYTYDTAIAVSGLSPLADECIAVLIMRKCGLIDKIDIERVLKITNNPYLEGMF